MNYENSIGLETIDTIESIELRFVKSECCGIYGLRNRTNGKWYVGSSKNISDRWKNYRRLHCKSQPKLYRALRKYGFDGFDCHVIVECSIDLFEDAENYWIMVLDAIENGYNVIPSYGNPMLSADSRKKVSIAKTRFWTPERRLKRSEEMKKLWKDGCYKCHVGSGGFMTVESREKLSRQRTGIPMNFSKDALEKMRESGRRTRGRKLSEETKRKMRETYWTRTVFLKSAKARSA